MACFIVPTAEAVVTTVATNIVKSKESAAVTGEETKAEGISFSRKLSWLNNMLWGGSALLAFEHVWHGEVTPWFTFLTAAADPMDAMEMLKEMSTVGVAMAVVTTCAWALLVAGVSIIEKRAVKIQTEADR